MVDHQWCRRCRSSPTVTAPPLLSDVETPPFPLSALSFDCGRRGPHERRRGNRGDRKSAHELLHRIQFLPSHAVPAAGVEARFPPGVSPRLSHPTACGHHLAYTHRRRCQDTNVLRPPCYQSQRATIIVGFAVVRRLQENHSRETRTILPPSARVLFKRANAKEQDGLASPNGRNRNP